MIAYIIRRLLLIIPTLFGIMVLNFCIVQIAPGGVSQTVPILAERIKRTPDDLRAILDSPVEMQRGLWDYIPQIFLADVESRMYDFAREQMMVYWNESKTGVWPEG